MGKSICISKLSILPDHNRKSKCRDTIFLYRGTKFFIGKILFRLRRQRETRTAGCRPYGFPACHSERRGSGQRGGIRGCLPTDGGRGRQSAVPTGRCGREANPVAHWCAPLPGVSVSPQGTLLPRWGERPLALPKCAAADAFSCCLLPPSPYCLLRCRRVQMN